MISNMHAAHGWSKCDISTKRLIKFFIFYSQYSIMHKCWLLVRFSKNRSSIKNKKAINFYNNEEYIFLELRVKCFRHNLALRILSSESSKKELKPLRENYYEVRFHLSASSHEISKLAGMNVLATNTCFRINYFARARDRPNKSYLTLPRFTLAAELF